MPLTDISNEVWTTLIEQSYRKPKLWQFLARDLSSMVPVGGKVHFNRVDNRGTVADYTGADVTMGSISANKLTVDVNKDKVSVNKLTSTEEATIMASSQALADFLDATANGLEDTLEADIFTALNANTSLGNNVTAEVDYAPLNVTDNKFSGEALKHISGSDKTPNWSDETKGPANRQKLVEVLMAAQIRANGLWWPQDMRTCAVSDEVAQQLALYMASNYHFVHDAENPFIAYGSPGMLWGWNIVPSIDIPEIDDTASNQMYFLRPGEGAAYCRRLQEVKVVDLPAQPARAFQQHYVYGANASFSPDKRFVYSFQTEA